MRGTWRAGRAAGFRSCLIPDRRTAGRFVRTADSRCHDVDLLDRVGEWFGHEKVFSMEFLTKPPDADTVQLFNKSECMAFQNPYRQFMMCAEPGYTMDKAKEAAFSRLRCLGSSGCTV